MFRRAGYLVSLMVLTAAWAAAQSAAPSETDMYCSGIVTAQPMPSDAYVISGQEAEEKIVFRYGDNIFINKGANAGVKVGDELLVSRPVADPNGVPWFAAQPALERAMGIAYEDEGRIRVVSVQPETSIAQIVSACNYVQRGDIVQPFVARPAPPYKAAAKFDPLAPPSGKSMATVVMTKNFGQEAGNGNIVYVNVGSAQGVKVGDYLRFFTYQTREGDYAYQTKGMAYKAYGFGSTPIAYKGPDLPRDVLGEGIVLRVGTNAATVLVTTSLRSIFSGDYAEIE